MVSWVRHRLSGYYILPKAWEDRSRRENLRRLLNDREASKCKYVVRISFAAPVALKEGEDIFLRFKELALKQKDANLF